jgi:hypothetical protein
LVRLCSRGDFVRSGSELKAEAKDKSDGIITRNIAAKKSQVGRSATVTRLSISRGNLACSLFLQTVYEPV